MLKTDIRTDFGTKATSVSCEGGERGDRIPRHIALKAVVVPRGTARDSKRGGHRVLSRECFGIFRKGIVRWGKGAGGRVIDTLFYQ